MADYTGITSRSVRNVLKKHGICDSVKDDETASKLPSLRQSKLDSFDKAIVKKAALSLISKNQNLNLRDLKAHLKTEKNIDISKVTLWKTLHALGFKYGRVDRNKMGLYEWPDIVKRKITYLREIDRCRKAGKNIVYLDETWIDTNCYPKKQWLAPEGQQQRKLPSGKGQRFVIHVLHCGGKGGSLQDMDLVFQSKHNDGRDYHGEMNGEMFQTWVENTLLPALPDESVVVMDNASYHSVQVCGVH